MDNKNKNKKIVIYMVCIVLFLISIIFFGFILKRLADNIVSYEKYANKYIELQEWYINEFGRENAAYTQIINSSNETIRELTNFIAPSSIGLILSGYFLFNFTYLMFFYDDKKIMSLEKNRLLSKLEKLKKG